MAGGEDNRVMEGVDMVGEGAGGQLLIFTGSVRGCGCSAWKRLIAYAFSPSVDFLPSVGRIVTLALVLVLSPKKMPKCERC